MRSINPDRHLRGSFLVCPKCGSRAVAYDPTMTAAGYGPGLAVCNNPACHTMWEPFDPAQIWDKDDPLCSFRAPCNNCAFRPGSPEQEDTAKWRELIAQFKAGATFYCHKGVPITPTAEHGFAYPDEGKNPRKLRLCRGWLNGLKVWTKRFRDAGDAAGDVEIPDQGGEDGA